MLTTTRNLLYKTNFPRKCFDRFDLAYPNIDPNQEVSLLDMLSNDHNTLHDVLWALRATKQNSMSVSSELARKCVEIVKYYTTVTAAWSVADNEKMQFNLEVIEERANEVFESETMVEAGIKVYHCAYSLFYASEIIYNEQETAKKKIYQYLNKLLSVG